MSTIKDKLFILGLALTMCFPTLYAQNHPLTPKDGKVDIVIGGKDDTVNETEVFNILIENAPKSPQYRTLPQFAIVGKNKKFYLSISGQLKSTVAFDWGNPLSSDPALFITSAITAAPAGSGAAVSFTAKRSNLAFNFVGLPGTDNQVGVYISFNFTGNGNSYGASLLNAYAQYRGFQAGYNLTMYLDQGACPYTIDAEGPNSCAGFYNTLFNYQGKISKRVSFGIGIESPIASITTSSYSKHEAGSVLSLPATSTVTQRFPDIPLYLQYAWGTSNHVRASAMLRNLLYRDLLVGKNEDAFGWGVKLTGSLSTNNSKWTTYFMAQYGKGVASYMQDSYGLGLDLIPSPGILGRLDKTKVWGGFAALQYNYTANIFSTLIYSQLRNYMDKYSGGSTTYDDQYQWGQYILGNLIWNINKYFQIGAEYIYGRRMNFSGTQHHDNRIMAMFSLSF